MSRRLIQDLFKLQWSGKTAVIQQHQLTPRQFGKLRSGLLTS